MQHSVIGQCPVCGDTLEATVLYCPACDTAIHGHFGLGRFGQLTQEQLCFALTFIRCEGKITRVEEEMGISYPTVRNRLHDLIRALGFETDDESPPAVDRSSILERLSQGEISAAEAVHLLKGKTT